MRVKIIGAGSIGNHLAQAARRIGWNVVVVDNDAKALIRMKKEIYPSRYGAWDNDIELYQLGSEPKKNYDIIMIGTPPDVRMKLALTALEEKPKILHLEKPLCTPQLELMEEFGKAKNEFSDTIVTVGYDHAVAESIAAVDKLLKQNIIGEVQTIDVEFREHWQGIFSAHPWLSGPRDTYLGYWRRGGGAGGEHSHALHLWLHFASQLNWGEVSEFKSMLDMRRENGAEYDQLAVFLLKTEKGKIGRVVQDVITYPVKKWARIQGQHGFIEWVCGGAPAGDLIRYQVKNTAAVEKIITKTRADDFYRVMLHYRDILDGKIKGLESPLSFTSGLAVMKILNKAYK